MRKTLTSALFVVLAILAMAVPASAQRRGDSRQRGGQERNQNQRGRDSYQQPRNRGYDYGYGRDQVSMLMNENMRMVCSGWDTSEGCLEFRGGYWGQSRGGHFYGYYDNYRRRISPRIMDDLIVGGVSGIISGIIQGRMNRSPQQHQDPNVIVTPPYEQQPQSQPQQQQNVRWGTDGVPVAVGTRPNVQEPVSNSPASKTGEWRVTNRTSIRVELSDGEQFIARIEPGQSVQVDAPQNGYKAVLLIPNRSGGLDKDAAQIRSSAKFNGWDIVAPAVQ